MESELNSDVLVMRLKSPQDVMKYMKLDILKTQFEALLSSAASNHSSAKLVATVAETTSWCQFWDIALNCGVQGMCGLCKLCCG